MLILKCILLTIIQTSLAKNSYVVVMPKSFRPGVPLSLSVNILQPGGAVNVKADLINNGTKTTVATAHGSFQNGHPGILDIQVPDDLQTGSYKVHVQGSGHGLHFTNETSIAFESKSLSIFIQTDKAMYKPGQTVNFRTFAIYPNLTVYHGTFDVDIFDANSNKIKQWRGLQDATGVVTNLLLLDTQPVLGDWKVKVTAKGISVEKRITIEKYVLPKYEVAVDVPSFLLITDHTVQGTVKATYTYGKPVSGQVTVTARLEQWHKPYSYNGTEPMAVQTMAIDSQASFSLNIKNIHDHTSQYYLKKTKLIVTAMVTEDINNVTQSGHSSLKFFSHAEKIEFLPTTPPTFKPGFDYTAYVKVTQQDNTPLSAQRHSVQVTVHCSIERQFGNVGLVEDMTHSYNLPSKSFHVPDSMVVPVTVSIPSNCSSIKLTASYNRIVIATTGATKTESPSHHYMQLELQPGPYQAGDVAMFNIKSSESFSNGVYQVMSRGSIVATGTVSSPTFSLPITADMAPNPRVIVYYVRADGEVVTDSVSFDVDGLFKNQVSVTFDKSKAQPHENVNVVVTADPQSIVNLLAVDQSVLLLKSGNDITQQEVVNGIRAFDTIVPPDNSLWNAGSLLFGRRRKRWWGISLHPVSYGGDDAYSIFSNSGVKVMSDANVYNGPELKHFFMTFHSGFLGGGGTSFVPVTTGAHTTSSTGLQQPDRIRNNFPETWLWTTSTTGADGRTIINTTVPDTITSWVASAFAINSVSGLGVAPTPAKIQAFKPFFVSLKLPYSVVRGEQLALQANVFNYMTQDLDVVVTLKQSNDFRNIITNSNGAKQFVVQTATESVSVPAGEARSVFFPIVPAALGKIPLTVTAQSALAADGVQRQLLVEAEGVAKEYSIPVLIDLKNTSSFTKDIPISLPNSVVVGSERLEVTAIGDLMGPTVNGLDHLLKMPTGCGEQTILRLAPDIFVTNYLSATNQLTDVVKTKATRFMESGYQRELTYQHKDGSFSAFGDRDKSGSMWLTAFVVKSFHQAKKQIFIDNDVIVKAIDWMLALQKADGSFPEPGHVHHRAMQSGTSHGVGLTAFVVISLLENNDQPTDVQNRINNATSRAVQYLETAVGGVNDDYILAITSYALHLAKSPAADSVSTRLYSNAISKDGTVHWHKGQSSSTASHHWQPPHTQANPVDIEMTAYALLVPAFKKDLVTGIPIMKWLTSQRNANGGFSSTQDTIVALQALSEYAVLAFSQGFSIEATISTDTFSHKFSITNQNSLVLQSAVLPSIPGHVTVSATGNGLAIVDINLSFHVEQEIEEVSFKVDVTMVKDTQDMLSIRACTSWLKSDASGMAVVEFGVPTGFDADLESLEQIALIKRVETEDRKVILYFDEITSQPICVTVDVFRTGMVAKSQPSAIRVYDYYQPSNQVTAFYKSAVLANADICAICAECNC